MESARVSVLPALVTSTSKFFLPGAVGVQHEAGKRDCRVEHGPCIVAMLAHGGQRLALDRTGRHRRRRDVGRWAVGDRRDPQAFVAGPEESYHQEYGHAFSSEVAKELGRMGRFGVSDAC